MTIMAHKVRAEISNAPVSILNNDAAVIAQGKTLYEQVRAACYSKNLGGAFGFIGLWQGDMHNICPNVSGRGDDPSLPLGDCVFHYQLAGATYNLLATTNSAKNTDFQYMATGSVHKSLQFQLPQIKKLHCTEHLSPSILPG